MPSLFVDLRRLPKFLLAGIPFLSIVLGIAGRLGPVEAAFLALLLLATAVVGARSRGGTEAELLAEIERRKEAEQAARSANRVKSEFLANMSHELRTPLNAVIGSADLLRAASARGTELSPEDRRHVETIDSSAESLLALIDDILDFAKLEAGRLRLEAKDFGLRDLVENVRRLVSTTAEGKGIGLEVEIDADLPDALHGDPARLRQILLNLAANAVKFTVRGQVDIRVTSKAGDAGEKRIRFTVRDTGIGISPEDQQRIFDTFYQADSASARRFSGSGLGLSISKELIRRMGGEFGLESTRGVGSTFWVELPLRTALAPPSAEDRSENAVGRDFDRSRFRILIVDDEPINRRLASAHLKALGYRSEAVGDGPSALARQEKATFDAVLMDCQMATVDGYETARRWRRAEKQRSLDRTPIIALTARALPGEREKCLAVGMDDYLTKPYRGADLKAVLDRRLGAADVEESTAAVASSSFEERIGALRRLGEVTGEDILGPAIESFPEESAGRLAAMREAIEQEEAATLAEVAHGFVSVAGALGADHLVDLLRQIEARAMDGELEGAEASLVSVEVASEHFEQKLRELP